jgi:hypothetical protein
VSEQTLWPSSLLHTMRTPSPQLVLLLTNHACSAVASTSLLLHQFDSAWSLVFKEVEAMTHERVGNIMPVAVRLDPFKVALQVCALLELSPSAPLQMSARLAVAGEQDHAWTMFENTLSALGKTELTVDLSMVQAIERTVKWYLWPNKCIVDTHRMHSSANSPAVMYAVRSQIKGVWGECWHCSIKLQHRQTINDEELEYLREAIRTHLLNEEYLLKRSPGADANERNYFQR